MRRRALLATLAASTSVATAGCSLFRDSERRQDTFAVSDTPTETTTSMGFDPLPEDIRRAFAVPGDDDHRVAVTAPTEVPDDVAITVGFTSEPSTDTPATLYARAAVPETADDSVDLPVGSTPPLSSYRGMHETTDQDETRPMFLVPRRAGVEFDDVVRRDQGCWRPRLPVGPQDATGGRRTLDPGESLAREYYLVTPWANDRCLRAGAYRFEAAAGWQFHVCPFHREPPGDSAYADETVPDLPGFLDTHWYHDGDAGLYLRPRVEQVGLPSATARLTFRNQRDDRVLVDETAWAFYKLESERWYPIAPLDAAGDDVDHDPIYPGRTSTLSLSLFTDPDPGPDAAEDRHAIGGLDQGLYAVAYPATLEVPGPNAGRERPTAALITVVGNPPTVDATDAIDHVTDREDVRHVHTTPDETAIVTLHLERTTIDDSDRVTPPVTPLITEQILQRDALRNAIVQLQTAPDPIDTVVYHTTPTEIARTTAWIDPDANGLYFTYDDTTYRMTYD